MASDTKRGYVSLQTTTTSDETLEVDNGMIVDSTGTQVRIGGDPRTSPAVWGDDDEGVDRVKGASPTGKLRVVDGNVNVEGHGDVTLTNAAGRREVSNVGNANGRDKQFEVDSNGDLFITYIEQVTRTNADRTSDKAAEAKITVTVPADAYNVEAEGFIEVSNDTGNEQLRLVVDEDGTEVYNQETFLGDDREARLSATGLNAGVDVTSDCRINQSDSDTEVISKDAIVRYDEDVTRTPNISLF